MKWIAGLLAASVVAGCGGPEPPARTVNELAEDPAVLQGLLARCQANKRAAATDPECTNARVAMERLGREEDAKRNAGRAAEFERQRTLRRDRDEAAQKAAAEARPAFDPYTAPVATEPSATTPKQ
jgi:hypothetical protein